MAKKLKEAKEGKIKYVPPPPVKVSAPTITRDGKIGIKFNQPLQVPDFIKKGQSGRLLAEGGIPLSEINVQRDIIEFIFIQKSGLDDKIEYSLDLDHWTEEEMGVKINFKNPLLISKGKNNDAMVSVIKNKNLFVSKESGEPISSKHSTFANPVPRQVPHSTSIEVVDE